MTKKEKEINDHYQNELERIYQDYAKRLEGLREENDKLKEKNDEAKEIIRLGLRAINTSSADYMTEYEHKAEALLKEQEA